MSALQLPNLEEAMVLFDVVRQQVRTAAEQQSVASPERALMMVPFGDVEQLSQLDERRLMTVVKHLEHYDDFVGDSEFDDCAITVRFFYVTRRVEVLMLTERVRTLPELQLSEDVAALASEHADWLQPKGSFDFLMPASVVDYYQTHMDKRQRDNFRDLLREYLSSNQLSIVGRFDLSILQIERNE